MQLPEKVHPFEKTKRDFLEKGVLAELVIMLKAPHAGSEGYAPLIASVEGLLRANPLPEESEIYCFLRSACSRLSSDEAVAAFLDEAQGRLDLLTEE